MVRIKKAVEKFEIAKANLQQIQIQLMTASGQEAIMSALKGAVGAYKSLNKLMDPKGMQRMRQEIMSEVMDDTMSMNDDTVAEDTMVDQVLQEIGVSITGDMVKAGTDQQAAPAETSAVDTGLQDRLNNL